MVTVHHDFDGVRIEGTRYSVWIHPLGEWRAPGEAALSVGVDATSRCREGWARLPHDMPHYFAIANVELREAAASDELHCLSAPGADTPAYRAGFALALEPGIQAFCETGPPRVEQMTHFAAALPAAVERHLGRSLPQYAWTTLQPHEKAALNGIAAAAVLGPWAPAEATMRHRAVLPAHWAFSWEGDAPQYAEFGAALREADVATLLATRTAGATA